MRRKVLILGVFVLALACAGSAHTAPRQRLLGWIDYPGEHAIVRSSAFVIAGWEFDCNTGEHPQPFAVPALLNLDTGQWYRYETYWQRDHLARPDVRNAYRVACPRVHGYEGYQLYVVPPPPPGNYRVWVFWDRSAESRDVTVIGD